MTSLVVRFTERRLVFAVLAVAVLAVLFWTGSRYPQLDEKAMMSGAIVLEDPIAFDPIYVVSAEMPVIERIAKTTLNWIDTNK
jgi:Flp pilus assembly protein CpaB